MSEVQSPTTELAAQYGTQVASDLERNATEQARISADLEALQEQLQALQRDHGVLVNIQQALGSSPVAVTAPAVPHQASTTSQRGKSKKTAAVAAKKAAPKKTPAKASAVKAAKPASGSAAQLSLVDLVRDLLEQTGEPRSAAEITTALTKAHPDRSIKTTVVRTTVENLVAKSQAQRAKQGSSVFYTAAASSQPKAVAAS
ncbi:hypothetical protein OID55_41220 [Streptomyces sp. NBC_00715]|uniref:hypothetical protein n=1 Tax=unclassified Streptomyces TaxID=2593676 RepID=UPI0022537EFD|nr:hypothetical protein [Streptomyces sp. NBC_00687]MCX4920184.1 hypothetical protein [Streptomyces sp. NBC_00687]